MKVYNFSAGPSTLPTEALLSAQNNLIDYDGKGLSVMEMSHRSKPYEEIHNECISLLRELMNIPDNYKVLFMTGGATTQFEAVALNLMKTGKADYVVTGNFANNAYKLAAKYGDVQIAASSADRNHTYIPSLNADTFRADTDYVHITTNNTIFGTRYREIPVTKAPLVADMSSNILSEEYDVSAFGVIYAGAQKNIAPAGVTVVIVREDLIGNALSICPMMLDYKTYADSNSMYNTPPCFSIYMAMLNFRWLKSIGGIKEVNKLNVLKANMLYDFIDNSSYYTNNVDPEYRSIMNIPFVTPDKELDAKFIKEAASNGLITLGGHRLVGGMRASIYNAMEIDGVTALINFMKKFESENK
jgi:phosphoserine aminotransferase